MSDAKMPEEPSIEEILGSIRRIIADDDEAQQPAAASPGGFSDALKQADSFVAEDDEEPLELTQKIDEEGTIVDIPSDEPPARPAYTPPQNFDQSTEDEIIMIDETDEAPVAQTADPLVSQTATAATAAIMAKLARSTSINRAGNEGTTLEDLVKEMVRPMLREWLDQHLPELVQSMVERELERIARRVG